MKKMMSRFHVNGRLCLGICGFGALFCLSPLIFLIFGRTREANDASLQSFHNLSSDSANSYTAFFFVTIISTADVLLDLPPKLAAYFRATEKEETSQTATKISRLSEIERSIFIVGVLLQSAVGFLPTSTDVIIVEFVQNCTKNASLLLIFAPISVYLQRCTTTFTVSRIFAMALISTAGYILQTLSYFVEKRSYSWSLLILLSGVSMYAVSILFTMFALLSAIKYCIEKIKARKSPGNLSVRTGTTDDSDDELYTNYIPGLHMLSTLILGSAETSVALTPLDKIEDSIRNRNYVVLFVVVMVLVIELRVRKNEIARELVRSYTVFFHFVLLQHSYFLSYMNTKRLFHCFINWHCYSIFFF